MEQEMPVVAYGLTAAQTAHLTAALPMGYALRTAESVTDLIVEDAVCYIVNAQALDARGIHLLQSYYVEVGEYANEKVIWIGAPQPPEALQNVFLCAHSFEALTENLEAVLQAARHRYEMESAHHSAYSLMTERMIADSLEEDIDAALHRKCGKTPDPAILKRIRKEWTALLEVDAVPDLAAANEFACWLKANHHPFWISGDIASGMIPYLLGLTRTNPLPPHLYCPQCHRVIWQSVNIPAAVCEMDGTAMIPDGHNLVWQEFCSYGRVPIYVFHLPEDIEGEVRAWLDHHWLQRLKPGEWMQAQPYEDHLVRGNMHFYFGGEQAAVTEIPELCREDIFHYLKKHGFVDKDAFRGMNWVRKGRGLPVITEEMRTAGDSWIIERCENVQSLPSKADMLEQAFFKQWVEKI